MRRRVLRVGLGVAIAALLGIGGTLGASYALDLLRSNEPQIYTRSYSGFGYVNAVEGLPQGRCKLSLKLYNWVSLSPGFSLSDMPRAQATYTLYGHAKECQGLEITLASGKNTKDYGHIFFTAGQTRSGTWFLAEAPRPPTGCGFL
ncbi:MULTISPECIES: hypothetical protein [unclassified Meiothermus]|uniref:hypothetical protein n=1 Tax=unclassified Meiothermus TaxID=370471 RepID=UPI000D7C9C71|nr:MULTISPECIES: hypothetical protein [unclassified Meiothermus]PZA06457.1 hypothetical protein DNA98_12785 [Meiothermus sp. Pnk-1]RYM36276.1 hypothetical protein EWH23_10745 [Meiothermus sp. PNK-Is4]